jgi:hypothetical protein
MLHRTLMSAAQRGWETSFDPQYSPPCLLIYHYQIDKLVPAVWIKHTTYRLQGGS